MATGITPDLTDVEKMMAADGVKFSGFTSESLATRAKRLDEFQPLLHEADDGIKRYSAGARASFGFLAIVLVLGMTRAHMPKGGVVVKAASADDASAAAAVQQQQALWDALDDPSALLQFVAASGDAFASAADNQLQDDLFFPMDCDNYGARDHHTPEKWRARNPPTRRRLARARRRRFEIPEP